MLEIIPSNQFKKDLMLAKKRGCKIEQLRKVVNTLAQEQKFRFILEYSKKHKNKKTPDNQSRFRCFYVM